MLYNLGKIVSGNNSEYISAISKEETVNAIIHVLRIRKRIRIQSFIGPQEFVVHMSRDSIHPDNDACGVGKKFSQTYLDMFNS